MVKLEFDEQFFQLLKRALSEVLNERSQGAPPDNEPGEAGNLYVSKAQAAKILGCSLSHIGSLGRSGKLTRYHLGAKHVRFLKSEVLSILTPPGTGRKRGKH